MSKLDAGSEIYREEINGYMGVLPELPLDQVRGENDPPGPMEQFALFKGELSSIVSGEAAPGSSVTVKEFDDPRSFTTTLLGTHKKRVFWHSILGIGGTYQRLVHDDDGKGDKGVAYAINLYEQGRALVIRRDRRSIPGQPKTRWYATLAKLPEEIGQDIRQAAEYLQIPPDIKLVPFKHPQMT